MPDERLSEILTQNASKNFAQRILEPDKHPSLDFGGGRTGTHLMSWGETDGRYLVFPTIIDEGKKRGLRKYSPNEAFNSALTTGEFIEFKTPEEADWFSKNYKQYWKRKK